jgi:hypothetical protein
MRSGFPFLALLTLVLSGCAAADGAGTDSKIHHEFGEPIPNAGSIVGTVVDDATLPLSGATVAILALSLQVQTDENGGFRLGNIPPGAHTVDAVKLGYMSGSKRVEVLANEPTTGAVITLTPIPIVEPYVETIGPFSGYFECHIGSVFITSCAGDSIDQTLDRLVFPNNKRFMFYDLSSDNWETQWGEARWSPAAVASASGMAVYPSYSKRYEEDNGGHWYCEADGNSPIWFRYDAVEERSVCTSQGGDDPPAAVATNPLMLVADPGFARPPGEVLPRVLIQQKFEVIMTIFYGEPAPDEYTAFPDA